MKCVDTLEVDGKNCSVLETDWTCHYISNEIIIHSTFNGDSVFWYEPNSEVFQLIYAFNAKPGESWSFAVKESQTGGLSSQDSVFAVVDSVDSVNINGIILPRLYMIYEWSLSSTGSSRTYETTIIKYLGSTISPFDFPETLWTPCDVWPYTENLRCYEDSYLGFYETGIVDSCTFEKTGTFTGELEGENEVVRIFPNPAGNTLNISLDNAILRSVVIYDLSGREVFAETVSDATARKHQLNLSQLPPGAYVVKVETGNGNVIKKLIKQ